MPLSAKLKIYKDLLIKWSKAVNLVSPTTLKEAEIRHFEDSLQLLPLIPPSAKVLYDLGSGAGFPGLVLAIERPDLSIHLFESDQKKCAFLSTVSRETEIPVIIHNHRIEAVDEKNENIPDVVTARALASLVELLALSEQWWIKNSALVLIFPKGAKAQEEIIDARQKYNFDVEIVPSKTDQNGHILKITSVSKI